MAIIKRLEGKRVLILLASEFDDSEFRDVAGALLLEGAEITVASIVKDVLKGLHGDEAVIPDKLVRDVNAQRLYRPLHTRRKSAVKDKGRSGRPKSC